MQREELIAKMRARITMCRNLAASTGDQATARVLREMADEGERDMRRLQAEGFEANRDASS
jgi:hypothetical protein